MYRLVVHRIEPHIPTIPLCTASTDTDALWDSLPEHLRDNCHCRPEILEDKDWEREWMQHYQPLKFTDGLWICPSWLQPPDPQAVNILLDPGLAFGTGSHPTTAMCARALAGMKPTGKRVIDYGCGSGVLAIAALLLGADWALAIDNDPQALIATRNNARRNGIEEKQLEVSLPGSHEMKVELLVANILAGPLCQLAPTLCQHLAVGSELILSGILREQVPDLLQAYRSYLELEVLSEQEGWVVLFGRCL